MKANPLNLYENADQMPATEIEAGEHSVGSDGKRKLINPTEASPADYPLGSPQSRAVARAWVEAKSPGTREDVQRDEDALQLYEMIFELCGPVYPDWMAIEHSPIGIRGKELRDQIYGPIVPLHEDPSWTRWTRPGGKFTRCFGREPKEGDLLRWEHVRTMYGPEMNEIKYSAQIAAWHRQLPDLPCPLRFEDGRLFKRQRNGEWFEELSVSWMAHWWDVECDARGAQEYADPDQLALMPSILGIAFLGLIDGKHACRPATDEELRRPETNEFFREVWRDEATTDSPPRGDE